MVNMTVFALQKKLGAIGKRDNNGPETETGSGVGSFRALQTCVAYEVSRRILRGCTETPRSGAPKLQRRSPATAEVPGTCIGVY
jgi:hypothetical protein